MQRNRPAPHRGILNAPGGLLDFDIERHAPSAELIEIVEWYWSVSWSLADGIEHTHHLLNHPSFQLVVEQGESGVFRIVTGRASKRLSGSGRAFGAKFWPAAFHAVWKRPVNEITALRVPLDEAFGEHGSRYESELLAVTTDAQRIALADAFLVALQPQLDDSSRLARRLVELIAADSELTSVEQLAASQGHSKRSLQRLFQRYVGVSPKWVIQRYRLYEALEMLERDPAVDLHALAARLNYFDQAHFTRDFTRHVGRSPRRYLRDLDCAAE